MERNDLRQTQPVVPPEAGGSTPICGIDKDRRTSQTLRQISVSQLVSVCVCICELHVDCAKFQKGKELRFEGLTFTQAFGAAIAQAGCAVLHIACLVEARSVSSESRRYCCRLDPQAKNREG